MNYSIMLMYKKKYPINSYENRQTKYLTILSSNFKIIFHFLVHKYSSHTFTVYCKLWNEDFYVLTCIILVDIKDVK